jgi:hypothetical protein
MNEEQIKSLAMEMTGHTDDIQEAFQQWQREREALIDFFELVQHQEGLIFQLQKYWHMIRVAFWSKEPIPDLSPIDSKHWTRIKWERVGEAARRLDEWGGKSEIASETKQRLTNQYLDLPLFSQPAAEPSVDLPIINDPHIAQINLPYRAWLDFSSSAKGTVTVNKKCKVRSLVVNGEHIYRVFINDKPIETVIPEA